MYMGVLARYIAINFAVITTISGEINYLPIYKV